MLALVKCFSSSLATQLLSTPKVHLMFTAVTGVTPHPDAVQPVFKCFDLLLCTFARPSQFNLESNI